MFAQGRVSLTDWNEITKTRRRYVTLKVETVDNRTRTKWIHSLFRYGIAVI
jgi:hypothetical protein